ncbi:MULTISPECIES: dienelactone hydrolase family protein [unclassified Duganella]|uniref:dienelactone hydrolase family protein n=1 Tax=unclassified Duganella TaxID=2636909 RepID=UPI0006FAD3D9|nr:MULTISPECIES: dienelactone hydrolase family protein [unclassified Duganella]KQV61860.1 hydrolase [Duganella sp. Root336D2]KRB84369.1 hydrolase [Duganella sp. Root198D2]
MLHETASIATPAGELEGTLDLPTGAKGVVLFAHGSGSSRFSPRNNFVAGVLRAAGIGTLLVDLLTPAEDQVYRTRFNISLLAERLGLAADWLAACVAARGLPLGLFGASTGAAAALQFAAERKDVAAVVSRGGRPDLTGQVALARVAAPTLFIVGGRDEGVIELNESAFHNLHCKKRIDIVPGATHLFEEAGALEEVARLARDWFSQHLS